MRERGRFWTVSDLRVTSFDFANFEDRLESLERLGRCEKWKIDTLLKVGFVKYFESTGASMWARGGPALQLLEIPRCSWP